jgi:hypothetical protein
VANVTPKDLPPGGRVQNIEPSPHRAGTAYVAIYRYLLGDFAPYIYRTDDFGKTWKRITDGKNGIAADEPTRVVREDPDRAGLLYAGTEFGMYVSFDNGDRWQPFQMNLPVSPVTDIKVAHHDLVVSTQGRSFWILDNLTPLHQWNDQAASAAAFLFAPREAVRTTRGGGGGGLNPSSIRYPQPGAMIDYYLASAPADDVTMEILDASGKVIRTFTSAGNAAEDVAAEPAGGDDEEGGFRGRAAPVRLDKSAGLHRFTWDLRYGGPWMSNARPEGPNGPAAVPGKYSVRLTSGSWKSTQTFNVVEDPRILKAGVTQADLKDQFEHNVRVRELVSEVNRAVARLRVAQRSATGAQRDKLDELASHLITPSIRYSQPALQTHITYLYGLTTATDQKIGRDAIERYQVLRKELDGRIAELNRILGPEK